MSVISKAALAAELRVSKARVSQYILKGLPIRPDGKIDRKSALNWLAQNAVSGDDQTKGPARAARLVAGSVKRVPKPVLAVPKDDQPDVVRLCLDMLTGAGRIAAEMAVELGLPMATAYTFDQ